MQCAGGINPIHMQAQFRWATPLEIVTRIVPRLVAKGLDPFSVDLPFEGSPEVSRAWGAHRGKLSDEFLEDIAKEYLSLGRGYSAVLARRYVVSERTIISWVQKARSRGVL